jgi:hypothetical protein
MVMCIRAPFRQLSLASAWPLHDQSFGKAFFMHPPVNPPQNPHFSPSLASSLPPCCPQTIPGADGMEASNLAWARAAVDPCWRLFAATLSGEILELSITQLQPIASTDSSGGAVWALRAAPAVPHTSGSSGSGLQQQLYTAQLAAACADGSVKLFGVSSGEAGAVLQRSLPRVEGNALSLAWHPNGRNLVSGGSDGCMHVWDLRTGGWVRGCCGGGSGSGGWQGRGLSVCL